MRSSWLFSLEFLLIMMTFSGTLACFGNPQNVSSANANVQFVPSASTLSFVRCNVSGSASCLNRTSCADGQAQLPLTTYKTYYNCLSYQLYYLCIKPAATTGTIESSTSPFLSCVKDIPGCAASGTTAMGSGLYAGATTFPNLNTCNVDLYTMAFICQDKATNTLTCSTIASGCSGQSPSLYLLTGSETVKFYLSIDECNKVLGPTTYVRCLTSVSSTTNSATCVKGTGCTSGLTEPTSSFSTLQACLSYKGQFTCYDKASSGYSCVSDLTTCSATYVSNSVSGTCPVTGISQVRCVSGAGVATCRPAGSVPLFTSTTFTQFDPRSGACGSGETPTPSTRTFSSATYCDKYPTLSGKWIRCLATKMLTNTVTVNDGSSGDVQISTTEGSPYCIYEACVEGDSQLKSTPETSWSTVGACNAKLYVAQMCYDQNKPSTYTCAQDYTGCGTSVAVYYFYSTNAETQSIADNKCANDNSAIWTRCGKQDKSGALCRPDAGLPGISATLGCLSGESSLKTSGILTDCIKKQCYNASSTTNFIYTSTSPFSAPFSCQVDYQGCSDPYVKLSSFTGTSFDSTSCSGLTYTATFRRCDLTFANSDIQAYLGVLTCRPSEYTDSKTKTSCNKRETLLLPSDPAFDSVESCLASEAWCRCRTGSTSPYTYACSKYSSGAACCTSGTQIPDDGTFFSTEDHCSYDKTDANFLSARIRTG